MIGWLAERAPEFRESIECVAVDTSAVYAAAVRSEGLLPNATLVVDHFYLVQLANPALTKVRRRVTVGTAEPPRPQGRSGMSEPPTTADRTGTTVWHQVRAHMERDCR